MPWTDLGEHLAQAFGGWNLVVLGAAGAGTAAMALSGADHGIQVFAHRHVYVPEWGRAAYYTGYTLPIAFPLAMYGIAAISNDSELWGAAAATTQALGVALVLTGVLKIATGRPFPTHGEHPDDPNRFEHPEYSREFAPFAGFDGAWAWPSGHTVGAFTIAASLSGYYHDKLWVPLTTYPIATAIAAGMVSGEHHWGSDVIAGVLISQAIGYTVGRAFRRRSGAAANDRGGPSRNEESRFRPLLVPTANGGSYGVSLCAVF